MFNVALANFEQTIHQTAVATIKEFTTDVYKYLNMVAPVDTSRYVSNMNIAFVKPDLSNDWELYRQRAGALYSGLAELEKMRPNVMQDVYITNTISYAEDLETTHSIDGQGIFPHAFMAIAPKYIG